MGFLNGYSHVKQTSIACNPLQIEKMTLILNKTEQKSLCIEKKYVYLLHNARNDYIFGKTEQILKIYVRKRNKIAFTSRLSVTKSTCIII